MGLDVLRKFKLHHHINTSTVTDLFYFFLKMKKCPLDNFFFFLWGRGLDMLFLLRVKTDTTSKARVHTYKLR